MKKILLLLMSGILLFSTSGYAHEKEDVLIDTDGSIDDLRAICQLISINEVEILAILTSDGTLPPDEGGQKVSALLTSLNILNIPVGIGEELSVKPPLWRAFSEQISWGDQADKNLIAQSDAASLLIQRVLSNDDHVTIFCLGPLTNLAQAIKKSPQIITKIERVIWYNESISPLSGFNYERDPESADFVLAKSGIQIDVISDLDKPGMEFSPSFLDEIGKVNNRITRVITRIHQQPEVMERASTGHFSLWDDLLPVYFLFPDVFVMEQAADYPNVSIDTDFDVTSIKEKLLHIYYHNYAFSKEVVFRQFPTDTSLYAEDLSEVMAEIIRRYGKEEWRKCVLTNEIHGHLGTYSIMGAKMGVKACEVLDAEVDRISVVSNAGSAPPLSCMNDGLQVSTGATLGLGMITISNDSIHEPSAVFSYNGKIIEMVLKKEVQKQIGDDIKNAISHYGLLTPAYWEAIRIISIKHWMNLDRNEIFDIIVL